MVHWSTVLDNDLISLAQWEVFKATKLLFQEKDAFAQSPGSETRLSILQSPLPLSHCYRGSHAYKGTGRLA